MNYTDPRCIRLRNVYGIEGYGLLHCLLDMLSANGGSMPADFEAIAMHLAVSADMVRGVACSFGLFPPIGDDGLLRHPDSKPARSSAPPLSRTERARRAARARWHKDEYEKEKEQQEQQQEQRQQQPATPPPQPPFSQPPKEPPCMQTELDLGLPPASPPPPTPAPLKQQAVALWCDTYKAHFGLPYQMTPRDAGTIANILQRIRRTAAQLGNASPSEPELLDTLRAFFQTALSDPFISENATLTLLSSQFNKIIKSIYAATNPTATAGPAAAAATQRSRAARDNPAYLQDLYRRVAEAGAGFVSNTG